MKDFGGFAHTSISYLFLGMDTQRGDDNIHYICLGDAQPVSVDHDPNLDARS